MKKSKLWIVLIATPVFVVSILILLGNIQAGKKSTEVKFISLGEVSDFVLTDQQGIFHQFSYSNDKQAIVLFLQYNGCPIVRNVISELQDLHRKFTSEGNQFIMINPTAQDDVPKD